MNPPGKTRLTIDHSAFLDELDNVLHDAKVPGTVVRILGWFITIYVTGISLAGAHAWDLAFIPSTIVALLRWGLLAATGQSVNEDVVREMATNAVIRNPLPPPGRSVLNTPAPPPASHP